MSTGANLDKLGDISFHNGCFDNSVSALATVLGFGLALPGVDNNSWTTSAIVSSPCLDKSSSESTSIEMILAYEDFVGKMFRSNYSELDRKMGYLGTVEDTKKSLEKLFKAS